jgi:hypothetical protein
VVVMGGEGGRTSSVEVCVWVVSVAVGSRAAALRTLARQQGGAVSAGAMGGGEAVVGV